MLNLIGECHSLSYDALTAHTAIVFLRYMLLSVEQRQNEDYRTLGELFFFLVDEMADITFYRSLAILMNALMASLCETLRLSKDQISGFMHDFDAPCFIIAADSGLVCAEEFGYTPDLIVGDMDSLTDKSLLSSYPEDKIRIFDSIRFPLHDHMRKNRGWSPTQVLVKFMILQVLVTIAVLGIILKVR